MEVLVAEAILALAVALALVVVAKELEPEVGAATAVELAPERGKDKIELAEPKLEADGAMLETVELTVEEPPPEAVSWPKLPETLKSGDWARMLRPTGLTKLIW